MHTKDITTLPELRALAVDVLNELKEKKGAQVIALTGELGAGKTAFTKELASVLFVTKEITSPTFVIMKSYTIEGHSFLKTLTHIDAYRIESDDEMRVIGFTELLKDPTQLICIEWPEKIASLVPKDAYPISFSLSNMLRTVAYGH